MSYDAMAADVAGMAGRPGIGPAELIGHSMGGKVAMLLACRPPSGAPARRRRHRPKAYSAGRRHRQEFEAMNELDLARLKSRADAESRLEARVPVMGHAEVHRDQP
jgi:esterase